MRSLSIVSSLVIADTALAEEANWRDVTIVQNSKLNVALSVLSEDGAVDGARTSRVQIEQTGKSNWAYTIQNFTIPYVEPVSGGDGDPMPMTPRRNAADDRTTATVVQRGQVNKASLYQNSPNNAALISQSARRGGWSTTTTVTGEEFSQLSDGRNYYSLESGDVDIKLLSPGIFAQSSSFGRNR
jgi:hypothetical protein